MKILENSIFDSFCTRPKDLSVYRIIFCLYILLFPGLPSFAWLGDYLSYYFDPPRISIANLFDGFPQKGFFIALTVVNICSFFFIFWGLWTKWSSIVFTCSFLIGSNFSFSFGKIDHTVLHFYVPLFMGILGWGEYFSIDSLLRKNVKLESRIVKQDHRAFHLAVFALLITFGFFAAGIHKIIGGWWKWDVDATRYWLYRYYYGFGRTQYLSGYLIGIDNHFFWKIQDYLVIVFEVGFLFSAFNRRVFRYFLATALIFHCMVLLMFNITFSGNIIAYLAFVDWGRIRSSLKKMIPTDFLPLIFKTLFVGSSVMLFFWMSRLIFKPFSIRHPSLTNLFFEYLHMPGLSELMIFILSILVLLYLIFIHFRKTTEVPV